MAKVWSAAQKDELAALLELKRPNRTERRRIEELSPGACVGCEQKAPTREIKEETK